MSVLLSTAVFGSWYWPFGDDDEKDPPRLSELMEPATTNIDAAADFAAEGNTREAVERYRAALNALERIERENPERADTPEFATVRNKRAYVRAAMDSLLLEEARENAKPVAVTDTTELERKLALEPWEKLQHTYAALTNADRLVQERSKFLNSAWAKATVERRGKLPSYAATLKSLDTQTLAREAARLGKHYRSAENSVAALKENVDPKRNAVCKALVRRDIGQCNKDWPDYGEALDAAAATLEKAFTNLLVAAAETDFPLLLRHYASEEYKIVNRDIEGIKHTRQREGAMVACGQMIDALNQAQWGVVWTGAVRRVNMAWEGKGPELPKPAKPSELVTNDGDTRPKMERQIDKHLEEQRAERKKVRKAAKQVKTATRTQKKIAEILEDDPQSWKARVLKAAEEVRQEHWTEADAQIKALLAEKPGNAAALNLRAMAAMARGDAKAAEASLDQAIMCNPRDYTGYYNMARLYLNAKGNPDAARKYYETGRAYGGPKDETLEKETKK